jgi:hypothetical protein
MRQIQVADLTASANEIDNRMGPMPGRSSDRIANELRWADAEIKRLREAVSKTRTNLAGLSKSDDDVYAAMVRRLDGALPLEMSKP